ncbi:hypothetical protein [Rhizobium paknamense]|uniref:Uncharacterized protein n=1 Tax=Rhizobium paknamense TaxID=1206817 RepID=A0ABU0ICE5_9HYPH|nr:hypothetical protein [Rhizobium paknamense]MDQ0454956.1 hypothetical protein [Rhizobium paknamense]
MKKQLACRQALVSFFIPLFGFFALTGRPAHALDRYYCAVDDPLVKLVVEMAFREDAGWPLAYLRGVIVFKPGTKQTLEGQLSLAGGDVKQYWRDGETLRLYTSSRSGTNEDVSLVSLLLESHVTPDDINVFRGGYTISVQPPVLGPGQKPVQQKGSLTCNRF